MLVFDKETDSQSNSVCKTRNYSSFGIILFSGIIALSVICLLWFAFYSKSRVENYIEFDHKLESFTAKVNQINALSLSSNDPKWKDNVETGPTDITVVISKAGNILDITEQRTIHNVKIGSWNHNNRIDLSKDPIHLKKGHKYGIVVYTADENMQVNLAVRMYGGYIDFNWHYCLIAICVIATTMILTSIIVHRKLLTPVGVFVSVMLIGLNIIITESPLTVPDETVHFTQAYQLSNRMLGRGELSEYGTVLFDNRELAYLTTQGNWADELWGCQISQEYEKDQLPYASDSYLMAGYPDFTQIISASCITFMRILRAPWFAIALSGKIGNLLIYAAAAAFASAVCSSLSRFILVFSLLPGCIFLGASYSYDSLIIAAGMVLFSNLYSIKEKKSKKLTVRIITMVVMIIFMTLIKAPFLVLMLLIPVALENHWHKKSKVFMLIISVVLLVFVAFIRKDTIKGVLRNSQVDPRAIPMLETKAPDDLTERSNISLLEDANPAVTENGDIYYPYSVSWCIRHPIYVMQVFIKSLIGQIGVNYAKMMGSAFLGRANVESIFITIDSIILLIITFGIANQYHFTRSNRILSIIITVVIVLGFYGVMMLSFSSIPFDGIGEILGVQGRYFIPLLMFLPICVRNNQNIQLSGLQLERLIHIIIFSTQAIALLQLQAFMP